MWGEMQWTASGPLQRRLGPGPEMSSSATERTIAHAGAKQARLRKGRRSPRCRPPCPAGRSPEDVQPEHDGARLGARAPCRSAGRREGAGEVRGGGARDERGGAGLAPAPAASSHSSTISRSTWRDAGEMQGGCRGDAGEMQGGGEAEVDDLARRRVAEYRGDTGRYTWHRVDGETHYSTLASASTSTRRRRCRRRRRGRRAGSACGDESEVAEKHAKRWSHERLLHVRLGAPG